MLKFSRKSWSQFFFVDFILIFLRVFFNQRMKILSYYLCTICFSCVRITVLRLCRRGRWNWQLRYCLWQSLTFSFPKFSSILHLWFCRFSNICLICLYSCFRILRLKFLPKLNQFTPKPTDFWLLEAPSMWDFLTESETEIFWKYLCDFQGNRLASNGRLIVTCFLVCSFFTIWPSIMFCLVPSST